MKRQNLRTVSLIVVTFTYLLFGAAIFGYLESDHEVRQREALELIELIVKRKYNISEDDFSVLTTTVIKSVPHKAGIQWKFSGAFYFATTVVTTIGYGHSTPATMSGRLFCMIYALIGIPLGLVMFQSIGERLNTFVGSALRCVKKCFKVKNAEVTQTNLVMVVSVLSTILMTSMAAVFAKYEGWAYFDALYYCFITLTTIGFGDYVALQKDSALQSKPQYVALSLIFILFGLSVVSSAVNLLVLKFLTLNTEDERRDEQLRYNATLNPIQLEGDVITSPAGKLEYARTKMAPSLEADGSGDGGGDDDDDDHRHLHYHHQLKDESEFLVRRRVPSSGGNNDDDDGDEYHDGCAVCCPNEQHGDGYDDDDDEDDDDAGGFGGDHHQCNHHKQQAHSCSRFDCRAATVEPHDQMMSYLALDGNKGCDCHPHHFAHYHHLHEQAHQHRHHHRSQSNSLDNHQKVPWTHKQIKPSPHCAHHCRPHMQTTTTTTQQTLLLSSSGSSNNNNNSRRLNHHQVRYHTGGGGGQCDRHNHGGQRGDEKSGDQATLANQMFYNQAELLAPYSSSSAITIFQQHNSNRNLSSSRSFSGCQSVAPLTKGQQQQQQTGPHQAGNQLRPTSFVPLPFATIQQYSPDTSSRQQQQLINRAACLPSRSAQLIARRNNNSEQSRPNSTQGYCSKQQHKLHSEGVKQPNPIGNSRINMECPPTAPALDKHYSQQQQQITSSCSCSWLSLLSAPPTSSPINNSDTQDGQQQQGEHTPATSSCLVLNVRSLEQQRTRTADYDEAADNNDNEAEEDEEDDGDRDGADMFANSTLPRDASTIPDSCSRQKLYELKTISSQEAKGSSRAKGSEIRTKPGSPERQQQQHTNSTRGSLKTKSSDNQQQQQQQPTSVDSDKDHSQDGSESSQRRRSSDNSNNGTPRRQERRQNSHKTSKGTRKLICKCCCKHEECIRHALETSAGDSNKRLQTVPSTMQNQERVEPGADTATSSSENLNSDERGERIGEQRRDSDEIETNSPRATADQNDTEPNARM